jgi:hypothetical protein
MSLARLITQQRIFATQKLQILTGLRREIRNDDYSPASCMHDRQSTQNETWSSAMLVNTSGGGVFMNFGINSV